MQIAALTAEVEELRSATGEAESMALRFEEQADLLRQAQAELEK